MKKFRFIALLAVMLLTLGLLTGPVFATATGETQPADSSQPILPDSTVTNGCHSVDARYPINGSDSYITYSDTAILYEVTSDTLVYTWNADKQMNPSSLVKLMTALLALEYCDLDEIAVCTNEALSYISQGALIANFVDGERLTVEQLLYSMLVGSCNDAAVILADHISGSQESFVNLMNRRAKELGCEDTVFTNATGLHDDAQLTTVRDVVRILREAIKYPAFVEIFATPNYTLAETNKSGSRYFVTTNYMISDESYRYYIDSRVTGGRTGTLNSEEYCLAVTASVGGGTYIAVVNGADLYFSVDNTQARSHGSFVDVSQLLNMASKSNLVRVVDPTQIVEQLPVQNGDHDLVIGTQETVSCVLPPEYDWSQITMRTEMVSGALNAPVQAGTKVADAQFWYGNICIAETELFALVDVQVSQKSQSQTVENLPGGFDAGALSTALMVLGIIFAVILLLFGGLFLVRTVRIALRNARSKKRRQERRRSK